MIGNSRLLKPQILGNQRKKAGLFDYVLLVMAAASFIAMVLSASVLLGGCASLSPAVQSDAAAVKIDESQIAQLQSQIKQAIAASTQPSAGAATQPSAASLEAKLAAIQTKLEADLNQQKADITATIQSQVSQATNTAAGVVSVAAPSPWGPLLGILIAGLSPAIVAAISHQSIKQVAQTAAQGLEQQAASHQTQMTAAITALQNSVPATYQPAVGVAGAALQTVLATQAANASATPGTN